MTLKVYLATHGCQMNVYDSVKMLDLLAESHGAEAVDAPEQADVLVLNTCSIREKAQEKVFSLLGRWKALKAARPGTLIAVGGCVASQEGEGLQRRAPFVDVVFGPQTLHRLPRLLDRARQGQGPAIDVTFPEIEKFDHLPPPRVDGPCAFVSVMEGCSKYCSFCVVPYTRGEEASRPFEDVLTEVAGLAHQGVREVTLLGQNVNAYLGAGPDGDEVDFATLLAYVAAVPGIDRIRFTTSHPINFGDALVEAFAELPELVPHVHLPVQSGSDRILAAMKRGHSGLEYKAIIRKLRAVRPDLALSSDFIVGFPGETEADFKATLALVEELGFDQSFSFIYSRRPGTPAANLPDDVPLAEKKARLSELQALLDRQASAIAQSMVGSRQTVLVDGLAKRQPEVGCMLSGRTPNNRVVNFLGQPRLIGSFTDVRIEAAMSHSLRGSMITEVVEASA